MPISRGIWGVCVFWHGLCSCRRGVRNISRITTKEVNMMTKMMNGFGLRGALCALLMVALVGCGGEVVPDDAASAQGAIESDQINNPDPDQESPADEPPPGEGPEDCICPMIHAPVCGEDGQTYGNSCQAACVDADVAYEGECRDNGGDQGCMCPRIYAPVCGEDGQTYGNSCVAGCADVDVAYEGECRDEGPGDCICPMIHA